MLPAEPRVPTTRLPSISTAPGIRTTSLPLARPSTRLLLVETTAPDPMAAAKLRLPEATSALRPMIVLLSPVVFVFPAPSPTRVLLPPVVLLWPANEPKNELC